MCYQLRSANKAIAELTGFDNFGQISISFRKAGSSSFYVLKTGMEYDVRAEGRAQN